MPEANKPVETSGDIVYDIAAVCRLTGLTAPGLRMWEKRHQAVNPGRTETGRRQYSRRDIQRLTLLKALSNQGNSIRTIVGLPMAELEKRLSESSKSRDGEDFKEGGKGSDQVRACRMIVIGSQLTALLASENALPSGVATKCEYEDLEDAEEDRIDGEADLLLVEIPALFSEDLNRVRRLLNRFQALRAIIVYAYAQKQTVENLEEDGGLITAIRGPLSLKELRTACATDIALANRSATSLIEDAPGPREVTEGIPERQFSKHQLARISRISSVVECECPNHLAALLEAMNGFEVYSAQCENRNAADAKIHAYLHRMTAHARATVEDALKVLVEFEDIEVGDA